MNTILECGPNKMNGNSLVGYSVRFFIDNYGSFIETPSNPTIEVRKEGASTWTTVDDSYVIAAGDTVRFSRQTGTKG
jgi:hypothetical protein